jgi:hypothetical protein
MQALLKKLLFLGKSNEQTNAFSGGHKGHPYIRLTFPVGVALVATLFYG